MTVPLPIPDDRPTFKGWLGWASFTLVPLVGLGCTLALYATSSGGSATQWFAAVTGAFIAAVLPFWLIGAWGNRPGQ